MKTKKTYEPSALNKTSKWCISTAVLTTAIIVGAGFGIFFQNIFSFVEGTISVADADDIDKLMNRFDKLSESDYLDSSIIRPYELVLVGQKKLTSEDKFTILQSGNAYVVNLKKDQFIRSASIKDINNETYSYFNESLSAGTIDVAMRAYQHGEGNDLASQNSYIDTYKANDVIENTRSNWDSNKLDKYSLQKYNDAFGRTLDIPCIYTIARKTVLSDTVNKVGDTYVVSIDLAIMKDDTKGIQSGIGKYQRQMISISGLEGTPSFYFVNLEYTLDNQINLLSSKINEKYDVRKFGAKATTEGTLTELYLRGNDAFSIPTLSENIDYSKVEAME